MLKAQIPGNENQRLARLKAYDILDTTAEEIFDDVTKTAAAICDAKISLVSLIDTDRQWFKSRHGLDASETPRDISFCGHTIHSDDVMVIEDAEEDERFCDNPLFLNDPHVRFYAGAPLITPDGFRIGTLCVIDSVKKSLQAHQILALQSLSKQVVSYLELKLSNDRLSNLKHNFDTQSHKFERVLKNMLEGLVVQASDGTVITHNPAALKILKLTEKQIIGRKYLVSDEQSIREDGRPFPEAEHPATVALKSKAAIKNIVMGIDDGSNETRWILINSTPFEADEGLNTLTTFTDITEKRKLQEETSFILNSMQVGTWKLDVDKGLLNWDDNNYEIFGVDWEEFADPSDAWLSRLHPNSKKSAIQDLADALDGKSQLNSTFEIITPDGSQKFLGARGEVFRDPFGVATRMVGINWDKTTEHLAFLELEQQKKLIQHHTKLASIGELAAGVGHEINNPLAVAKGLLFSLNQQELDQSIPVAATLSKVNNALDRIASIVKGLRTFSRIEEGEVAHFNVIGALEESIALMEDMYKSEGISIIYSAGAETNALGIDGSRGKLQQIFVNLLSNAKDAVKGCEIKNIHISTQIESNRLKISFKDSGCGIPKNIIDNIFDPFFTTKDVSEGTGIGLSLVYNFVNEFGGSVTVKSEEFQGAELVVDLLVTDFDSSNNIIEHNKITTDPKIDCSIILADDEEGIRDVLAIIIEGMGATVSTAENGREALALYLANPDKYDIIISDIKMPVMGGVELLQTIRTNKNLKQPKFIFITGGINMDFGASDNQLSQLIDAHFFKPFDYEEIFETLMKLSS